MVKNPYESQKPANRPSTNTRKRILAQIKKSLAANPVSTLAAVQEAVVTELRAHGQELLGAITAVT